MSLLTFDKQQELKPVSANNEDRFIQIMQEVEELELDKLLGTAFYQDVVDNYNPVASPKTIYNDLVEGCIFEDTNGETIKHKGLEIVLAYLNFASYSAESHIVDTYTGFVQKTRQDSEQVSQGDIKNLVHKNREIAFNYFEKTKRYLLLNCSKFPLYYANKEKRVKTFQFYGVKRTAR